MRAAVLTLLVLPLVLACTAVGGTRGLRVTEGPATVTVTNDQGTWVVRTRCQTGDRLTVGPGYVSRLVSASGEVVVDDRRRRGTLNDPEFGGLGAFGWHHARGHARRLRFTKDNAWEISGRVCARRNGGFGVVRSELVQPPERDGDAIAFAVDVFFGDHDTRGRPLLRVGYRYRVEPALVRLDVDVEPMCPRGRCGATAKLAFVKEPKLVAHVTGGGFARMATFRRDGSLACVYLGGGGLRGPILDTGQCGDPQRALLRFDHGTATSGAEGGCRERACLSVAFDGDLESWARLAAASAPAFARDTGSVDGVVWNCKGGSPAAAAVRRWETTGRLDRAGRYVSLGGLFPAWEGGRGGYDCEPLARPFPPVGVRFRATMTFSLARSAT